MAQALGANDNVQRKSDLSFITERLDGPDADLTQHIAALLRQGSLRDALSLTTDTRADKFGKKMPPSMVHWRSLREAQLYVILHKMEPQKFPQTTLEAIDRDTLINMATFALNVKKGDKLPAAHELLRFVHMLAAYCHIRYMKMGRRLSGWKQDDPTSWGHFQVSGSHIVLSTKGQPDAGKKFEVKQLTLAIDWEVCDNFLTTAYLWSAEEDMIIPLRAKCIKAGLAVSEPESIDWAIPTSEWPEGMRPKQALADMVDQVGPKRKRPRGNGGAKPRVLRATYSRRERGGPRHRRLSWAATLCAFA